MHSQRGLQSQFPCTLSHSLIGTRPSKEPFPLNTSLIKSQSPSVNPTNPSISPPLSPPWAPREEQNPIKYEEGLYINTIPIVHTPKNTSACASPEGVVLQGCWKYGSYLCRQGLGNWDIYWYRKKKIEWL